MANVPSRTWWVAQGTVIALITWGVLTLAKDSLGRTVSLVLAGLVLAGFLLLFLARARTRSGGGPPAQK